MSTQNPPRNSSVYGHHKTKCVDWDSYKQSDVFAAVTDEWQTVGEIVKRVGHGRMDIIRILAALSAQQQIEWRLVKVPGRYVPVNQYRRKIYAR